MSGIWLRELLGPGRPRRRPVLGVERLGRGYLGGLDSVLRWLGQLR